MNAAERAHIRQAIDDRARRLLADQPVSRCLMCDVDLPEDDWYGHRRFCGDGCRKQYHWTYGRYLPQTTVYDDEWERREARRASWRRNTRNQYQLYKSLLERLRVRHAGSSWSSHLAELRRQVAA